MEDALACTYLVLKGNGDCHPVDENADVYPMPTPLPFLFAVEAAPLGHLPAQICELSAQVTTSLSPFPSHHFVVCMDRW